MGKTARLIINLTIFGAGMGAGYAVSNKITREHYAAIAQDEIDSVKEYYEEKYGSKYAEKQTNFDEDEEHDASKDYTDDPLAGMSIEEIDMARKHHKRVVTDYTSMYRKPSIDELSKKLVAAAEEDEEELEDVEDQLALEVSEGMDMSRVYIDKPYIISAEQFNEECEHYDKIELFYYVEDDALVDENDALVDDDDGEMIGYDCFNKLSMQTSTWVRNELNGTDYAIHRVNGSYERDVVGLAETPKEREYRHLARRKSIVDGDNDE